MHKAYLLLGSNLGDRSKNLQKAFEEVARIGTVRKSSSVYESEPWGRKDQAAFLNRAVEVDTVLAPEELLARLLQIEKNMGRERKEKWGARLIDIDILLY